MSPSFFVPLPVMILKDEQGVARTTRRDYRRDGEGGGSSDILWHLKCTSVSHSHSLSVCQCVSLVLHKKGRASLFLQLFLILRIDEGGRSKRCSAAGNMQPPFLSLCSFSHSFHSVFSPCVTSSFPQWVFASPSTFSLPLVLSFSSPPLFCTPPPILSFSVWGDSAVFCCARNG